MRGGSRGAPSPHVLGGSEHVSIPPLCLDTGSCNESESNDESIPELEEPEGSEPAPAQTQVGVILGAGCGMLGTPRVLGLLSPTALWQAQLTHSLGTGEETVSKAKQSRSEKKARKVGWD